MRVYMRPASATKIIAATIFMLIWGGVAMAEDSQDLSSTMDHINAEDWTQTVESLSQTSEEKIADSLNGRTLTPALMLALIEGRNPALKAARAQHQAVKMQYSQLEALGETLGVYGQYLESVHKSEGS